MAAALVAGAEGAVLLVTRPDLVLPRITGAFSSTAGAWTHVSTHYKSTVVRAHTGALFLTLETLALVLVALAGAAAFLVAVALGAALVAAFLGAAFLAGASFAAVWSTSVQEPEEVRKYGISNSRSSWPWQQQSLVQPWSWSRSSWCLPSWGQEES